MFKRIVYDIALLNDSDHLLDALLDAESRLPIQQVSHHFTIDSVVAPISCHVWPHHNFASRHVVHHGFSKLFDSSVIPLVAHVENTVITDEAGRLQYN